MDNCRSSPNLSSSSNFLTVPAAFSWALWPDELPTIEASPLQQPILSLCHSALCKVPETNTFHQWHFGGHLCTHTAVHRCLTYGPPGPIEADGLLKYFPKTSSLISWIAHQLLVHSLVISLGDIYNWSSHMEARRGQGMRQATPDWLVAVLISMKFIYEACLRQLQDEYIFIPTHQNLMFVQRPEWSSVTYYSPDCLRNTLHSRFCPWNSSGYGNGEKHMHPKGEELSIRGGQFTDQKAVMSIQWPLSIIKKHRFKWG